MWYKCLQICRKTLDYFDYVIEKNCIENEILEDKLIEQMAEDHMEFEVS